MGHFLLCFRFSLFIYFVAVAVVLGLEPNPSQILDKHRTTAMHLDPLLLFFFLILK